MAAPKRTPGERERDLLRVAELYCEGVPQYRIAQAIGVSFQQIHYDVRILNKRVAGSVERLTYRAQGPPTRAHRPY